MLGVLLGVGVYYAFAPRAAAPALAQNLTPEQRAALQAQYDQLQKEISQWQKVIDDTKDKAKSLQGDVTVLSAQIAKAQAEINQRNNTITQLASAINKKSQTIATLESRLEDGQASLAKLLREKNQNDKASLVVLALSGGTISDFFANADHIDIIDTQLQQHFDELRGVKTQTEAEKQALAAQQNKQLDAKHDAQLLKQTIDQSKQQKTQLLTTTKGQEAAYNQVLAQKQKQANEIRNALFNLRDTSGITFESALTYATAAGKAAGVRPALILAILSQESDLGKNIGSCLVTSLETGDGKGKNTDTFYEKVMKVPRDTVPFGQITSELGLNWASTPVSCPLGKTYAASRGYGGALGPSQFIPSTWILFAPRIKAVTGASTANPWDPRDAIMATAIYMKDLGAGGGTYTAERNAACKYYSGRSCDSRSPANYTYGDSVVAKATTFQKNIDFLNNL